MLVFTIFLGVISFLFAKTWLQRRKLPPGPFPLPLIGNLHQIGYSMLIRKRNFVDTVTEFTKEYGSVLTLWFGPKPTVNICDYATAVEAMVKKGAAFTNRNVPYLFRLHRGDRGIIASNGPLWLEQRRFALHTLRNFGLGRNLMEERIMYEFEITCEELEKWLDTGKTSINPAKMFDLLVANIINRMLFTDRFEKNDEEKFFALKKKMDDLADKFNLLDILIDEWNVNFPLIRQRTKFLIKPFDDVLDFIRTQVEQRKRDIANGDHVIQGEGADFVDSFLIQIKQHENSDTPTSFDEQWLLMTLLDLWAAGQETTMVTLNWAFSYLLLHPQFKSRVEEELLSVTEGQRPLSTADRPKTSFYNAVLNEIHRCASIFPMNTMWRDTAEDTVVGPYCIAQGTPVGAQISLIMNDEKYFKDKREFNPDRYFTDDRLEQMVIPFSLGKRACPGESLAQAELYLIIGNFLLRYVLTPDPKHLPQMQARKEHGPVRIAQPYHMVFERR